MIRGIGTDMVDIRRIEKMLRERPDSAFFRRVFTEAERAAAPDTERIRARAEYFAARFAAKEAVFKAVAHLTPERTFDMKIVETLRAEDGHPCLSITGRMQEVLEAADVNQVLISLTTEGDYAAAFAVASREQP